LVQLDDEVSEQTKYTMWCKKSKDNHNLNNTYKNYGHITFNFYINTAFVVNTDYPTVFPIYHGYIS